jgi:NTE family protein
MSNGTGQHAQSGTGLAMSGGGFRATLFHAGSLWRLNELGLLRSLTRISSVSGGSITNGVLALAWPRLEFDAQGVARNFEALVVQPLRRFCSFDIDTRAIAKAFLPGQHAWEKLRDAYDEYLFHGAKLTDLPEAPQAPRFIFNATNLKTGRSFRFTRKYLSDYRIGMLDTTALAAPGNTLSMAVAASSGFPPLFSPISFDTDPTHWQKVEGADLAGNPEYCSSMSLSDGGVYDNLGLEPVWKSCRTVLISNAGKPFEYGVDVNSMILAADLRLMLRVLDVTMDQVQGLRLREIVDSYESGEHQGAYWGINTNIDDYTQQRLKRNLPALAPPALSVSAQSRDALAAMRTRLNEFKPEEQNRLINWGYAVCDAAMRSYGGVSSATPPSWPYVNFPLS